MGIKKIVFLVVVISSLFIINSLVRSIYSLWQKQHLVVSAREELAEEKRTNQKLKKDLSLVTKPEFIEEEARDKLFLAKPGEKVVVMPSVAPEASPSVSITPVDTRPYWRQWWEMFF
jgi:cell division protein FtsB